MDRLRRAYLSVAVVLIPLTAAYTWHVLQHSDGMVSRGEAALRAVLSVGVVVWTVLWSAYILGQNQLRRPTVARARVLQEATVQLPVVAQPAGELDGYAKGYADGLARQPMDNVRSLNGR